MLLGFFRYFMLARKSMPIEGPPTTFSLSGLS